MKKILSLIIGLSLSAAGHAQKERPELNLTKGEIYVQNITSNVSLLQSVNDQQINMGVLIGSRVTYKVIDVLNDVYDLEVRYDTLTMKMEVQNAPANSFNSNILQGALETIMDKPFLVKMTKKGRVSEVKNLDSLLSGMFDKFPHLNDAQRQQMRGQIMQTHGEKAFKANIEMCSAIFPDSLVSQGDKWTVRTQMESGMHTKTETVYELKEINDSYYQLFGDSKIETADKEAYTETNGMPLRYDLTGRMTSDFRLDKRSGWILSATIHQSMNGTIYIKDNPKLPGGMATPMTMTNEMTISGK